MFKISFIHLPHCNHTFMYLIPRVHNVLLSALPYTDDGKEMLKIMGFSKFKSTKVMREGGREGREGGLGVSILSLLLCFRVNMSLVHVMQVLLT